MKIRGEKRARHPRACDYTKEFSKDWARFSRAGRHDMGRMKQVMSRLIANDGPLDPEGKDHPLTGNWDGYRERHVGGDFLLIYRLSDESKSGSVIFVRMGTHSDLFG